MKSHPLAECDFQGLPSSHRHPVARPGTSPPVLSTSTRCSKTFQVIHAQLFGSLSTIRNSPCGGELSCPKLRSLHPQVMSMRIMLPAASAFMVDPPLVWSPIDALPQSQLGHAAFLPRQNLC